MLQPAILCRSCMSRPRPHPTTTSSGIGFHFGSSLRILTPIPRTNPDLVSPSGTWHCCLQIVLQLTMAKIHQTVRLVADLARPTTQGLKYSQTRVYILAHNLITYIFLQLKIGQQMVWNCWKKYVVSHQDKNGHSFCITQVTCLMSLTADTFFLGSLQPLQSGFQTVALLVMQQVRSKSMQELCVLCQPIQKPFHN